MKRYFNFFVIITPETLKIFSGDNMKNTIYKRTYIVFFAFLVLFAGIIARIYAIQKSSYSSAADMQFTREITLGETRGNIYDINMKPLVNEIVKQQYIVMSDESTERIIKNDKVNEIKKGLFVKLESENTIKETKFIKGYNTVTRYSENLLCPHIIGYTNSSGAGVAGIEKAFDKILSDASGKLTVSFNADATDNALKGDGIALNDYNYNSRAGIRLTIDKDIQEIAKNALNNSEIECGAVVILDVKTAEIRAISSIPCYNLNDIGSSLSDKNLPFLNRALSSYPVGSVFKPVIAVSSIKNGFNISDSFECEGSVKFGENIFSCFNNSVHGKMDLNLATEKSCNTFFINMGINAGYKNIYETAELFGFGKRIELCSTLISESGNLPGLSEINSDSALANLCFGQGSLLATPLQLAAAYNVFANNGIYTEPYVLKELINADGVGYAYYKSEDTHFVADKNIIEAVNNCLYNNMLNGTGTNGKPDNVSAAGKTATAQTGRYNDKGEEILCTWFCGYFPFENPMYTVVVFNENGKSASEDCAPVFKEIAQNITNIRIQPSQ